jgi:hypothetical protein
VRCERVCRVEVLRVRHRVEEVRGVVELDVDDVCIRIGACIGLQASFVRENVRLPAAFKDTRDEGCRRFVRRTRGRWTGMA